MNVIFILLKFKIKLQIIFEFPNHIEIMKIVLLFIVKQTRVFGRNELIIRFASGMINLIELYFYQYITLFKSDINMRLTLLYKHFKICQNHIKLLNLL